MLAFAIVSFATGPVGTAAGFEDDDGNLVPATLTDWNTFAPAEWVPHPATTPTRHTADETKNGFQFLGLEDWQATTSDSSFAGGTKQDADCPSVITQKPDNKADLKRVYVASKVVNGETYLELAWVRIPQNTTSPSAHIAFEFNQGTDLCGGNSDGLVERTAGDMLVVYDFEGGSTDNPHITLRRWVTSGACEISNDSPPCWGTASDLTDLGFAEAKVNTGSTALDALTPPALNSTTGTSVNSTLGVNEFGEAGIDVGPNGANIFGSGQCVSFGKVFGVSRTSGNSGTAQMKDLVGPGDFRLSNCGTVTIIKRTSPRGLNQNFDFTSSNSTLTGTCTSDSTPASFTLNDNGNSSSDSTGNTETCTNVPIGTYTVTEGADPSGFKFNNFSCTKTGSGTATPSSSTTQKNVTIGIVAGGDTVTCVYTNDQQLGAIKITKTSSKPSGAALAGAKFSITKGGTAIAGSPFTTDSNGEICVDGLAFGDYVVTETAAPDGYSIDDSTGHTVTVDNNAKCSDASFGGESIGFTDTPLTDLLVKATSQATGGTKSSISCVDSSNTDIGNSPVGVPDPVDPAEMDANGLEPGTYTCTVVIDP